MRAKMELQDSMMKYFKKQGPTKKEFVPDFLAGVIVESHNEDLPIAPEQSQWVIKAEPERLVRVFSFEDVATRNLFIGELLEQESTTNHFANIQISGLEIAVEVYTHDINTVTELDTEYAAYCDDVYNDVKFVEGHYAF